MSRIRTNYSNQSETVDYSYESTGLPGGGPGYGTYVYKHPYELKYSQDTTTPDFKRKRSRGEIVNNDCRICSSYVQMNSSAYNPEALRMTLSGTVLDREKYFLPKWNYMRHKESNLVSRLVDHVGVDGTFEDARDTLYPLPENLSLVRQEVLAKALAKASSSEAMALVSLAEARKTIESAGRLVSLIPRFKTWVKRQTLRNLFGTGVGRWHLSRLAARQWLEYRYAFMQLYYDVMSYKAAYERYGKARRVRYVSSKTVTYAGSFADPEVTSEFEIHNHRGFRQRRAKVTAGCLVQSYMPWMDEIRPLGLDRPLATIWELIPFSFIVDWFVNTSEIIAASDGLLLQNVVASWVSVDDITDSTNTYIIRGRDYVVHGTEIGDKRIVGYTDAVWSATDHTRDYVRTANPRFIPLPQLRAKLDWKKLIDLAALLRGMLKQRIL